VFTGSLKDAGVSEDYTARLGRDQSAQQPPHFRQRDGFHVVTQRVPRAGFVAVNA
jgi:hypothetical protein